MDIIDDELRELAADLLDKAAKGPAERAEVIEVLAWSSVAAGVVVELAKIGVTLPLEAREMVKLAAIGLARVL